MEQSKLILSQERWIQINNIAASMTRLNSIEQIRKLFLEQIQTIIPHKKAFFDLGYLQDGNVIFFDSISLDMTDEELNAYYDHYLAADYIAWMLPRNKPVIYRDSDIISHEARQKTEIYQNWMKPMGVYYSIGSTLFYNGILYGSITLFRQFDEDFSDEEVCILQFLTEHITANFTRKYPNGIKKSLSCKCDSALSEKYHITSRENEIIALIFNGLSNREIASKLIITENTVKKHINTIFRKLNVRTRTQLVHSLYSSQKESLA